jgi:hypothetical protein
VAPSSGQPFVLHIPAGWSNIGYPFNSAASLPVTSLLVATGDPGLNLANALPWATAVTQGVVEGSVYDFEAGRTPETDVVSSLQRFKGYWIRCLKPEGCQLIFPSVGSLSVAKATRGVQLPPDDWQLLIAAASGGHSVGVRLAANRMATDGYDPGLDSLPPPVGPGQTLSACVVSPAGALFKDSRSPATAGTWDIEVASAQPYADVTVTWPDLAALPRGTSAFLVDRDAGVRRAMRTTRTYSFNSGADGSTRHLSVEIGPADSGALSVSNIVIASTRGAGAVTIGFELSRAASAGVRVFNVAGRRVREVIPATEMSRGPNIVTWDLRSDRGTIVPSGSYMCEIKAASSDGQRARAVRSVFVGR